MCGITGIKAFNLVGAFYRINLGASMETLAQRGPDQRGTFIEALIALGHRRLSIQDPSSLGKQPMQDPSENYVLVFNGEIFNFKQLRETLEEEGVNFVSGSDTEVLLQLFIKKGEKCLEDLIGCFAFAIYNRKEDTLFLARDRFGIKPLLYFQDEDKFVFASEMKALLAYNIPRTIDYTSLTQYLHLNYIPAPASILKNVKKLEPGHCIWIKGKAVACKKYYSLKEYGTEKSDFEDYEKAKKKLRELLEEAVSLRLVSDVPLGTFLIGGLDSSIVTALAVRQKDKLQTFTLGFPDEPFFDESKDSVLLAKKLNTAHTVFEVSNKELFENFFEALDYLDEPFADSSALAVFILTKKTAKEVVVALSGDGADEVLGGYNKHKAEVLVRKDGTGVALVSALEWLWNVLPKSRSGSFSNKVRQLKKLATVSKLTSSERYYALLGFTEKNDAEKLLSETAKSMLVVEELQNRKSKIVECVNKEDFNSFLYADLKTVLPNDMLFKVDMMSMANKLEVRTPFLDHKLVEFAFALPAPWKTDGKSGKIILRDAVADLLPEEVLNRRKRGFEVPLLIWLKTELKSLIENKLLEEKFIRRQNIFEYETICKLKKQLFSSNPGDSPARVWALVVFQFWYLKYIVEERISF